MCLFGDHSGFLFSSLGRVFLSFLVVDVLKHNVSVILLTWSTIFFVMLMYSMNDRWILSSLSTTVFIGLYGMGL